MRRLLVAYTLVSIPTLVPAERLPLEPRPLIVSDQGDLATRQLSGQEAVRAVDWDQVGPASPIPRLMPSGDSDDPLDAGFAPEWAHRALKAQRLSSVDQAGSRHLPAEQVVLQFASERTDPRDSWAHGVQYELSQAIQQLVEPRARGAMRVFCNARGCLFYIEGETWATLHAGALNSPLMEKLRSNVGWVREFGITWDKIYQFLSVAEHTTWSLTFIERPDTEGTDFNSTSAHHKS